MRSLFDDVRQGRGKQLRPLRVISLFSGLCPESQFEAATGLTTHLRFSCDINSASWNFINNNDANIEHHIIDVWDVARTGCGMCAKHGYS